MEHIIEQALDELHAFDGEIHGIMGFWDFPVTSLVPILCRELNLPGPSVESVTRCTHKFWSRVEQKKSIPECTPKFCAVDPFSENPLNDIELDFPFWIKPVKAFASFLGFKIRNRDDFYKAIDEIREKISQIGKPYNTLLQYADLPDEIQKIDGNHCIAEQIIDGYELAPEGYVYEKNIHAHGLIDCSRDNFEKSFVRWEYPSTAAKDLQKRVMEATRKVIRDIKLDNSAFNVEFFWDRETDQLWIVEINPRISQSHCYQFAMVDGASNHDVALSLCTGQEPHFPDGKGPYNASAKFVLRKYEDAKVSRIPSEDEIARIEKDFPDSEFHLMVEPDMYLHDLPYQDAYSYELAHIFMAAEDHETLLQNYENYVDRLNFQFTDEKLSEHS